MEAFTLTTRDHSSTDYNLKCINHTAFFLINNSYEEVAVPGRDCPFIRDNYSRNRVTVEVEAVIDSTDSLLSDCISIKRWLTQDLKDKQIQLSNMDGYYLMGFLDNKLDIEQVIRQTGRITLKFNCQPYLYMSSGDEYTTLSSGGSINNPGSTSNPLIQITCSGSQVQFTIGSCTVDLRDVSGTYYIDSASMDMYMYSGSTISLQNSKMYSDFPTLQPGANTFTVNSGTVSSFRIMPRWRV